MCSKRIDVNWLTIFDICSFIKFIYIYIYIYFLCLNRIDICHILEEVLENLRNIFSFFLFKNYLGDVLCLRMKIYVIILVELFKKTHF